MLRAYEAAWNSRNVAALRAMQVLDPRQVSELEQLARESESWSASVTVESISVGVKGNDATVVATVRLESTAPGQAPKGGPQRTRIVLVRRSGSWIISSFGPL